MSGLASISSRFQQLPRALQWSALAALALALFMLWAEYLQPVADRWDRSAEGIESRVKEVRAVETVARELENMKDVVITLGPVEPPTGEQASADSLNSMVNQVLEKNNANNQSSGLRSKTNLPKTALMSIVRGSKRVERHAYDLKFESTPQAAAAIVAELESSPYIEAVTSLRMTRDAAGKVKVTLTIEAWVLSAETAKREIV